MNTMLADSLTWIAGKLEAVLADGTDQTAAVIIVLKELMELHGNVVFGGDGYSPAWHKAAVEERGLRNIPTTADALPAFKDEAVVNLFMSTGVLSPKELNSRFEVYAEQYILSIEMEARLVVDIATTRVYPAAIAHMSTVAAALTSMAGLGIELDNKGLKAVATTTDSLMAAVAALEAALSGHYFNTV